ncbi:MAG: hypothetical protein P4N41_13795 [Negativicutes bacterium]|nr:hypothetical protein [Negativicutes bacterium]MDR3590721.1 hypothetical protein [Negativicutes bacterium]
MELLPSSDFWWRYFIYGALFHFVAITPFCKTDQQAGLFRFAGTAVGVLPVLLREGLLNALLMAAFLYGWTMALKFVKSIFK